MQVVRAVSHAEASQHSARALAQHRLPICFPQASLQLLRLSKDELAQVQQDGWLREAVFRVAPSVTKVCEPSVKKDVLLIT